MNTKNTIAWGGDQLGRKEIADILTDYIDEAEHIKVVNINSPWGTGKTFFLTNWRAALMEDRAVVYFNAWENDFTGDPMISLVANIRDQLREFVPQTAIAKKKFNDFLKSAGAAVVSTAPVFARGITRKLVGVGLDELSDSLDEESQKTAEEMAEKFVERMIETNADKILSVHNFKTSLAALMTLAVKKSQKPVYIFIDELDRCRPTYAIELLERVKHLFDVEGCKFVIATDTTQLAHSICAVYGGGFASIDYLKRFFDISYTFDEPNLRDWVLINVDFSCPDKLRYVKSEDSLRNAWSTDNRRQPASKTIFESELSEAQLIFLLLANAFKIELRQLWKIKQTLEVIITRSSTNDIHFFYAAYLCFLQHKDERLFDTFIDDRRISFAAKEIDERFSVEDSLYFLTCNRNVHSIANDYARIRGMDRNKIHDIINSDSEPSYMTEIGIARLNGKDNLARYPGLIKLAMGIR
ncbi:P-loop NTPase fold protein [Ectopseudomonas toyotomiensis]|uniref:KAP family NTPase n=1 Tax=Ectopseudomonas toyotomiensis TaxID=554344 RepID=A0AA42IMA3_9GAMM|nr:P-loop NTPase fold protein [Pseudomonas toyotomiensis]MBG0840710.1 P-loop ATPase [Pseudomonas toyotomiensis]MDH0702398.1 KAP family NTPase [Pseudomonas toyotomiensis]